MGKTKKYYDSNPDAKKVKSKYDSEFNKKPEQAKKRAELNQVARDRGIYGKRESMGKDLSHTKKGGLVLEDRIANRKRNGSNGKSTKK